MPPPAQLLSRLCVAPEGIPRQPDGSPTSLCCSLWASGGQVVAVVEAPNWANALDWGPKAALEAWGQWSQSSALAEKLPQPGRPDAAFLLVRPGFPRVGFPVWMDPFTAYRAQPREPLMVYLLSPRAGAQAMQHRLLSGQAQDILRGYGLQLQQLDRWGPGKG